MGNRNGNLFCIIVFNGCCFELAKMMLTVGSLRSYSDVCRLTGGKINRVGNKIIGFDREHGLIRCEAGATLYDLIAIIQRDGWALPVVPGTGWATVGGCIANDVHGKNQATHGSFGNYVTDMNLPLVPTIGGLGLTGTIKWATIELERKRMFLPYLFPLDYIPYYWPIYKKMGLLQYQCVVPPKAVNVLLRYMTQRPLLMVKKNFGDIPSVGMLSFCRPGTSISLDLVNWGKPTKEMLYTFDSIVEDYGGALYPAKYSMSYRMFRYSFPRWKEFSRFVHPGYSSDFWQRVNS